MTRAQKGKRVQDRYTRKRKQTTPVRPSPEAFQPPHGARCYLTELPMELYSLIMHHLLEEPLNELWKSPDPPIKALSHLARTSSALNSLTIPFLYEDISVRMSPDEPLCVPPSGSGPSKKRSRILAGLGLSQGDSTVSSDSHKLLYSKFNVLQFVKTLRVKASRLPDEERLNSNLTDSVRKTRSRRGTLRTDGIHTESVVSLNLSMLIERMPKLVQLHWEIDNFIGPVLQSALSKSSIELIQVAHSQYIECSPIGFLHDNHTLIRETAVIPKLDRLQVSCIRRASQLRQIGRLIGFNATLKQIGLKLHRDFEEDLDEEPEALTLMLNAWMDARKESLCLPGTIPFCPQNFMLQDLHLSTFPIDEDAEQVLSIVLNHCGLTSLAFRTCCLLSDLSILFSEWRHGKFLRHLIFHTDSLDDHAIDFPSFAEFLIRTGKVNQRLLSLELRGGWKFLNFMEADLEKVKASGVFNSLVKLVWEACVATWCEYCVGQKTKREEMRAFADLAGSCLRLQHLAIPGLFIGGKLPLNGVGEHIPPEEDFSHARHAISTLPFLRHLHVQETDQRHPQWAEFPCCVSTGTLQTSQVEDSFEDPRFSVKNSPNPSSSGDEVLFGKVSCALARLSMNGKTVDDFPADHLFFSVTFGLWGESRHLIWVNRIRETKSIEPDKNLEEGKPPDKRRKTDQDEVVRLYYRRILETSKHLGGPAWIHDKNCSSSTSYSIFQPRHLQELTLHNTKGHSRNLAKELSTTLSESTYDVDSPYKARQRASLLKSTAPYTGKTYFDTTHNTTRDTDTVTVQPKAAYVYSTILDQPLTVEMIQSAQKIHPYQFEVPIKGNKNRLRVELKDGTNWIANIPEPTSDAGRELFRTSTRIKEILEKWAKECLEKEIVDLKWEFFARERMELASKATAMIWERDLVTRQTKKEIHEKLMSDEVFFVQKQKSFGTPSFCSYVFCLAPEGRTPLAGYRLSLEPRDNARLSKVPGDAIPYGKRGHGDKGARWFCLACVEAIWDGVGLVTPETLANAISREGRRRKTIPRLPAQPTPSAASLNLSQSLYTFMEAETRDHEHGYFTLPHPQHAALLKWKTTIVRRTENDVESNIESRKQSGTLFDGQDPDDDYSHDEKYWIKSQDSNSYAQLRGLADPSGKVVELCTAECRDKKLSEIYRIIDARVQDEWDRIGHVPQPPPPKKMVVLKFDYFRHFPHLLERVAKFRDRFPRTEDSQSDMSDDISESSSSSEEL